MTTKLWIDRKLYLVDEEVEEYIGKLESKVSSLEESSFKAGIKEVVDWIKANEGHKDGLSHYCPNCDTKIIGVAKWLWLAKLKEWGISDCLRERHVEGDEYERWNI